MKGIDTEVCRTSSAFTYFAFEHSVFPHEVLEKYGNTLDWRNTVGTGPFFIKDYVSGSSLTYVRNPNYWEKDPVGSGKGNQWPYLDGVKMLVIPDYSTQLSALRTGKIDKIGDLGVITREDTKVLKEARPQLLWDRQLITPVAVFLRADIKPFNDIKVRRALNMAIDKKAIVRDYFGGEAEALDPPARPGEHAAIYTPIEQLPESARELYEYSPDKAKQLLSEAGYPNGFKFSVLIKKDYSDMMSIFKDYYAKIGVQMVLDLKDDGVWSSLRRSHAYEYAVCTTWAARPYDMRYFVTEVGGAYNYIMITDPHITNLYGKVWQFENINNQAERDRLAKEATIYTISQAYYIDIPSPYQYDAWWPWVKNYYGVRGKSQSCFNECVRWIWLDQELKREMGY